MTATRKDIDKWFDEGVEKGATHMVVVCDTYDHDDYPVFVNSAEQAREKLRNPGSMQRVMEVYLLSAPKAEQLDLLRCFRYA